MNDVRQDITLLKSDQLRKCAAHSGANCDLPRELDSFGAGFSCTSYSLLNTQATQNASAMDRMTKHGIAPDDPEEFWPKEMTLIDCPFFFAAAGRETRPWTMRHGTKVVSGSQWALVSEVASVSTFAGCLDILDCCRPVWALFENVEAIDREVDQNTHLVIHWFGLYRKEQTKFLILQQMKQQHQCNISNKKCQ